MSIGTIFRPPLDLTGQSFKKKTYCRSENLSRSFIQNRRHLNFNHYRIVRFLRKNIAEAVFTVARVAFIDRGTVSKTTFSSRIPSHYHQMIKTADSLVAPFRRAVRKLGMLKRKQFVVYKFLSNTSRVIRFLWGYQLN